MKNRRPAHPGERRAPEPQPPAGSQQWLEPTVSGSAFFKKDSDLSSDDRVLKTQTHVQKEAELV